MIWVLVVAAALVALEWLLRLTGLPRWRPPFKDWRWLVYDPFFGWLNAPGHQELAFAVNSLGLRGPEPAVPKPPGVTRLICLGDSSTFGLWQAEPPGFRFEGYPDALRLSAPSHLDVINAGVPYDVLQRAVPIHPTVSELIPTMLGELE